MSKSNHKPTTATTDWIWSTRQETFASRLIFAMTDDIAERARKVGGNTLHSISDISKHQRLKDDNRESIPAEDMLAELRTDNRELTRFLRITHKICQEHKDVATASLIEVWIDETERRTWFLSETVRNH